VRGLRDISVPLQRHPSIGTPCFSLTTTMTPLSRLRSLFLSKRTWNIKTLISTYVTEDGNDRIRILDSTGRSSFRSVSTATVIMPELSITARRYLCVNKHTLFDPLQLRSSTPYIRSLRQVMLRLYNLERGCSAFSRDGRLCRSLRRDGYLPRSRPEPTQHVDVSFLARRLASNPKKKTRQRLIARLIEQPRSSCLTYNGIGHMSDSQVPRILTLSIQY
jgi:hypothetical protein